MSKPMLKFPSIEQFKNITKHVRDSVEYHNTKFPEIKFMGSVKIHGTNASFVCPVNGTPDNIYFQSRERVLDMVQDNAGFCAWGTGKKEILHQFIQVAQNLKSAQTGYVQIYGEWFGSSIQKAVGVTNLKEKYFSIFAIRISDSAENQEWFTPEEISYVVSSVANRKENNIYCKLDFPTWQIDVDFTKPESMQNTMIDLTMKVEEDCPVARHFFPDTDLPLVGEGIVWEAISSTVPEINIKGMQFKVKGEKHSSGSKVKIMVPVDEEKVASVREFVEKTVTIGRLNQGIQVMKENGKDPYDSKNTGEFIKWVMGDVLKEEIGMLTESGLCTKDVTGPIAQVSRKFYLDQI